MNDRPPNRLLQHIAADEYAVLAPHLERVTLPLHTQLIKPHEPMREVWFPLTMLASLVTVLEDGTTVEAGSVGREGMVGVPVVLDAESTPMQTVTQVGGEAIRINAAVFRDALRNGPTLRSVMNRYVHTLFVVASQSAACNRRHQIEARLARWLLMSSDGIGSDQVGITQEYLAAMLGVRRAGVTEAAVRLQDAELIRYGRGNIAILDRAGLEAAACECYCIVKDEYERLFS